MTVRSDLLEADERVGTAADFIPAKPSLKSLREAAADCTACPLHLASHVLATVLPSSLRLPPEAEFRRFVSDLRVAAGALPH